jgi:hypothetical protein
VSSPAYATARHTGRTLGPLACELLEAIDVRLLPWQSLVLDEWLAVVDDPDARQGLRLARTSCGLIVPRRNGKTLLVAVRALVGILVLDERRVTYTAHRFDTALETFSTFRELVTHPAIVGRVKRVYDTNGKERVDFHDGSRFSIRTRGPGGGRGLETDLLIVDEALVYDDDAEAALTPLTARAQAEGRGQRVYASSAGTDGSIVLDRIAQHGRQLDGVDGGTVAFHEWAADREAPIDDPDTWAAANPSLGSRLLTVEFLASQRAAMTVEAFGREHLGWWADNASLPAIDPTAWAGLAAAGPVDVDPSTVAVAFDVTLDRTAARVVAVAVDDVGRLVVRVPYAIEDPGGIDDRALIGALEAVYDDVGPEWLGYDRLGGSDIAARLADRGYPVKALGGAVVANACGLLRAAVRAGGLAHDGSTALAADLARAVPRPFGDGGWTFARRDVTSGSIAGAIALSIAVALATANGPGDSTIAGARES